MENIKFSVLMPSFKRPEYLRGAVESVINQSYKNFELIVKEGGEKAVFNTLDGLDLSRVTLIFNEDLGISDALNQMMMFARGKIFIWCSDDDRLELNALETINKHIGKAKWGFAKMKTSQGQVLGCPANLDSLKNGNCICQPTVFWTREAYDKVGFFNCNLDLASDYDYWVRLMRNFEPVFIDRVIARYTVHNNSLSITKRSQQLSQADIIRREICI